MTNDPKDDMALDALFEAARDAEPVVDDVFAARLMPPAPSSPAPASAPQRGFDIREWLPALGGLGMATAVGVWIGVAVPIDSLLNFDVMATDESLDLSAFYAGADPGIFFSDETGL